MIRTKETNPVARKTHICSACGKTINKGEIYLKIEETCIKEEDSEIR